MTTEATAIYGVALAWLAAASDAEVTDLKAFKKRKAKRAREQAMNGQAKAIINTWPPAQRNKALRLLRG